VVVKVRPICVPEVALGSRVPARTRHHAEQVARNLRVLTVMSRIAAAVSAFFGIQGIVLGLDVWWLSVVNLFSAAIFLMLPMLYRFGDLVAPLVFFIVAYASITVVCWHLGTGSGLQFYFLIAATLTALVLGFEHIVIASVLSALGVVTVIVLELSVPNNTGVQSDWAFRWSFILTAITAWMMVAGVVWYALREIGRAREAMEAEYERSERLLTNILPATIAERLKDPSRNIIADKYDDASVLFADIAGYTKWASDTTPSDLVRFLDRLYTELDALVDRHGLEPAWIREGENQRRFVHGGQRRAAAPVRSRRGARLPRPGHGRRRRRSQGSAWPGGAASDRPGGRTRGRRRGRRTQVLLRRVG
jgi:adenylate cyclase